MYTYMCSLTGRQRSSVYTSDRVPTGQGKLERIREFVWSGKGRVKYLDHANCRYMRFFVSSSTKKQANLQLLLSVQKLEVFRLQGGFCPPGPPTRVFVICLLLC